MTEDWRATNLANWESRVPLHTGPDGYDLAGFDDPPAHLSDVVRYDLPPRLGRSTDWMSFTCNAISAPTPSRSPVWARNR